MITLVFILVLLVSYYLLRWWKRFCQWDHFPGYSKYLSFPIIGHGHLMVGKKLREFMQENKKAFGDMYRFDMGPNPTVFINNFEYLAEALKLDAFGGRTFVIQPGFAAMRIIDKSGDISGLSSRVRELL